MLWNYGMSAEIVEPPALFCLTWKIILYFFYLQLFQQIFFNFIFTIVYIYVFVLVF